MSIEVELVSVCEGKVGTSVISCLSIQRPQNSSFISIV